MPDVLIPLALMLALLLLVPRAWLRGPGMRRAAVWGLIGALAVMALRYLGWRVTQTLPGPESGLGETVFAWVIFVIEMAVLADTIVLFATLGRRRNNSPAADAGEARLRAMPDAELPTVDVFIATYNEDLEVLEKTILGALALDWPREKLRVCVLDDGKRDWLRDFCERKGADHFTRPNNAHAKAGNINAAIARTDSAFFMVLDADFVPQRNFLYRAMGLFEDPKVGIVQIPHSFYNADPLQTNLGMRQAMPDDQRLFFGEIMAGRDGWNAAFCCGSNSITRRTAIEAVGGGLPTGSITEDMLLTLAMLRKGYVTRYLNERLAIGLAPESLDAMYVQRARWARGAMQILFLREGPFGPGLRLHERIMFVPSHWIVQPFMLIATLAVPAVCLWTGWSPMPSTSTAELISYQLPVLVGTLGTLRLLAPDSFFPLAATVHSALLAPRILPTVLTTLVRPHGHAFKVTPKGRAAAGGAVDRMMIYLPTALIVVTALGFAANANFNTRIIQSIQQVPLLAFWGVLSMLVLTVVQAAAVSATGPNREERFGLDTPATIGTRPNQDVPARVEWLSLSGAGLRISRIEDVGHHLRWLRLDLPGIGRVAARVESQEDDRLEVSFAIPEGDSRDALLRLLFTNGHDNSTHVDGALGVSLAMLSRIFRRREPDTTGAEAERPRGEPPQWLRNATAR